MPLTGNLSEFPLPEVLLLLGGRTGRLRLANSDDFIPMEIDLSEGYAHGLHIEREVLTSPEQIVAELSYVIETGLGTFEFRSQPVISVDRKQPLLISELVMQLVLRVDEKLAKQRAVLAPELFYVLVTPVPVADIKGDLRRFYVQSRLLLSGGVRSQDLAEYLGLDEELTRLQLYHLHQAGLVRLVETTDVEALRESMIEQEFAGKNRDYEGERAAPQVVRRSGKLLRMPGR